jgi:superfamily II DNA helicase RecQ
LIALQRDQVESIAEEDVGEAALVNSTLRPAEREDVLDEFTEGTTQFLFLAPEQLASEETLIRLQAGFSSSMRRTASVSGVTISARSTSASALSSKCSITLGSWP